MDLFIKFIKCCLIGAKAILFSSALREVEVSIKRINYIEKQWTVQLVHIVFIQNTENEFF